jgi:rhodanese-related sulfurtransferase
VPPITTVKHLDFERALEHVNEGAAWLDMRPVDDYLAAHIPESLCLVYEFGPGMAGRARDCIPLSLPLVLLDLPGADMRHAAGALRGKGFEVVGVVPDGLAQWEERHGPLTRTDVWVAGEDDLPSGTLLDVSDSGAEAPKQAERVPIEHLYARAGEVTKKEPLVVIAGYGVRAALAVGILERAGARQVGFFKSNTGILTGALRGRHGHPSVA